MNKNFTDLSKEALKRGVLFGFVPHNLEIPDRPELWLFPFNVMFANYKNGENGKIISASTLYEPMLSTYKLDQKQCSMEYFNIYGHGSWLLINYDLENSTYLGEKYVGDIKVGSAFGKEWKMFFVHFTMLGLSNGERCKFD
ncbi:MAG: hypothetical protein WCT24_03950 [Patescibacteria group bacterium]|jgi:hypothetical protein